MENALLAGVSPAPKQGPQNAVLTIDPVSMRSARTPFLASCIYIGVLAGYTESVNSSAPMLLPLSISAASQIFSYPPPAHPAIIPCSTYSLPSLTLSLSVKSTLPSRLTSARFSTSSSMSMRLAFSSSMVYVLLGWNGMAIIGLTVDRSTYTTPS